MKKEGIVEGSPFITYQRKGLRIHKGDCTCIAMWGAPQVYSKYYSFDTYEEAYQYAKSTNLKAKNCSRCLDGEYLQEFIQ